MRSRARTTPLTKLSSPDLRGSAPRPYWAIARPTVRAARSAGSRSRYFASGWTPRASSVLLKKQRAAAASTTSRISVSERPSARSGVAAPEVVPTTVASKLVVLFPQIDEKEHHDGRRSRMTVADVVAQVRDGRLEDFVREAVELVARELMEAEVSGQVGAELGEVAPEARVDASQWVSPAAVGDAGRGDRADDPPDPSGQLFPELP